MQFIDLKQQYSKIKPEIIQRIDAVLEHGRYIMGPEIDELEQQLADFVGVKHAIAVSSGTDALLMALMALGIKAGDEVITTPFSFIATAEVIALLGAKPVYVDIEAQTYNINPELIESAITDKTKAIMPVSLYGQCADMDSINAIAAKYNLPVIEDAAQSFGAQYKGRWSCNVSTVGCTSFFPSKPLGCYGDGGAIFSNDDKLVEVLSHIRNHGQDRRYHHPRLGINGRLDSIQAAVLLAKLKIFPQEITLRQQVAKRYDRVLSGKVRTPIVMAGNTSVYAQYTVAIDQRDELQQYLSERNIPTAVHYPTPLHLQPSLQSAEYPAGSLPVSERCAQRVISLAMHPYLSERDQDRICQAVLEFCAQESLATVA